MPVKTKLELPPESVLKLYRAVGLQEFFGLLGWSEAEDNPFRKLVPKDQWKTGPELFEFCQKYDIPINLELEREYLVSPDRWHEDWPNNLYQLYLTRKD